MRKSIIQLLGPYHYNSRAPKWKWGALRGVALVSNAARQIDIYERKVTWNVCGAGMRGAF